MQTRLFEIGSLIARVVLQNNGYRDYPSISIMQPASAGVTVGEISYAYTPAASVSTGIYTPAGIDAAIEALIDIKTFLVESQERGF